MPPLYPLRNSTFSLDISSLAGFLGADAALAVMMLPHLHAQRRWWGWYNCPGSYHLAKRYGQMARFRFWSPSYRSAAVPQEVAVELEGVTGPAYTSAQSGAVLPRTGPLATMLVDVCAEVETVEVDGRHSDAMDVAIVRLWREPPALDCPRVPRTHSRWLSALPMLATLSTSIVCGIYGDWFITSMVLFSALCHGLACLVMGNATFTYQHHIPHQTACFASGWLEAPKAFVVLCGTETAVAPITRGRFSLRFEHSKERYYITLCSILLGLQFLAQLLFVPQGKLFGQTMFIASLVASWAYHRLILARGKESIQRRILMADVLGGPQLQRYRFGTRTAAAVFSVFALREAVGMDVEARLKALLPTDTPVWQLWHATVAHKIAQKQPLCFEKEKQWEWQKMHSLSTKNESLLFADILQDAETAYYAYCEHLSGMKC